jgi:hypothetical protein
MNETLTAVFSRGAGNAPQIVVFDPDSTLIDQLRSRLQVPCVTFAQRQRTGNPKDSRT